jgi:hypothetical protein
VTEPRPATSSKKRSNPAGTAAEKAVPAAAEKVVPAAGEKAVPAAAAKPAAPSKSPRPAAAKSAASAKSVAAAKPAPAAESVAAAESAAAAKPAAAGASATAGASAAAAKSAAAGASAAVTGATPTAKRAATTSATRPARSATRPPTAAVSEPTHRHPNMGKAPMNMRGAFPEAADVLRAQKLPIAARALEAATTADPTFRTRFGDVALRRLLRDTETLIERVAMCVGSGDTRWLAEYAEWVGPIFRRRGVPLADVAAICEGVRSAATPLLEPDAAAQMGRALDAGIAVFRKNGRIGGDQHKRNALLRWLYRGV